MALDRSLLAMFPHTVTIQPSTGEDPYGTKTYGVAYTAKAYIDAGVRETTGHFQEVKTTRSRGQIMILTSNTITEKDKLTLPSPFVPTDPEIIEATPIHDEEGDLAYWEIGVGDKDRS